jgi:hypothetical protein
MYIVRNLHLVLGHNVTRVRELRRTGTITIRGKEVRNARSLWTFEAYESGRKLDGAGARLLLNRAITAMFPVDSHFAPQKITAIEPLAEHDTYDITVEGTHNFAAEGLVVHNSGFVNYVLEHFNLLNQRLTAAGLQSWAKVAGPAGNIVCFEDL